MKAEDFEKLTKSIQKKLGQEQSSLINDDLATMVLDNKSMNEEIVKHQETITTLKKDKDDLIMTNNRLFQQVAIGEEVKAEEKQEDKKPFNFRSVFDDKGNFI